MAERSLSSVKSFSKQLIAITRPFLILCSWYRLQQRRTSELVLLLHKINGSPSLAFHSHYLSSLRTNCYVYFFHCFELPSFDIDFHNAAQNRRSRSSTSATCRTSFTSTISSSSRTSTSFQDQCLPKDGCCSSSRIASRIAPPTSAQPQ